MRRIAALFALAATLAACAPVLGPQTPTDPTPAVLSLGPCKAGPQCILFNPGAAPATLGKLTISGTSLRVNDTRCAKVVPDIVCQFDVTAQPGQVFALEVTGTGIFSQGEYTRGGLGPYTASF